MVELLVEGRPDRVEMVVVDAQVARAEVLVGMHDHLEAMPVHAPALVSRRHVGQPMRRLEAAPHVRMARGIEVHAFVPRALDADLLDARHIELFDIDMRRCPRCGGVQVKIIAAILERAVIGKILTHLGLDPQPPPRSKAREAGLEFAA